MGADRRGFSASHEAKAYAASGGTPEGLVGGIHSDELQLAAMSGKSDSARSLWRRLAWLPVPLLAGAIIVLWAANLRTSYESPNLLIGLNFLFSVAVSLLVVYLIGRSFLARGAPGLLMLGCGVIIWGAAGFVGATAGLLGDAGRDFANITVTIHNTSVWFSAACHLVGVTLSLRQRRAFSAVWLWLTSAYAAALVVVGLVTYSAIAEWTPTFFIQGQGGTPLRQFVLGSATGMFALTAALLGWANRRFPSAFTYWYSLALTLIAVGLFGVMMEPSHGGPLSWTGRVAQFLGGAYMLIAAIVSVRESGAWEIPLEEALHRQPAFISEVLKTVGALVFVLDRQGRIVSFNRACEEATAYSALEVKGKYVWDFLLVPDEIEAVKAAIAQLQAGRFPNAHENYWVAKDGTRRLIHWTSSCLTDSFGAVEYMVGTGIEVTDRRRAEEALRASEVRFRALVQNSSDIIVLLNGEGTILYQSPSIKRLLGYGPEERIGRNIFHDPIVHPDDQAAKQAFFETARSHHGTPVTAEFRLRHADGSWRYVEVIGQSFLHDPEVAGVVANYRDITERKRAEEALREAKHGLEIKVIERTAELQRINDRLREENQERVRTEESLRLEEARLDALLHLNEISEGPLEEISAFALERAIALTHSKIGFLGFLNEDESICTLNTVSREVVRDCGVAGKSWAWRVADAGIWADAIRERKTLIVNDYSKPHPRKKGFPHGHLPVERFMVVPVFEGRRIVALAGVGNKASDYDRSDERQVVLLLSGMWSCVQKSRSRAELQEAHDELENKVAQRTAELAASAAALRESHKDLDRAQEVGQVGSWRLDVRRNVLTWSDETHRIFAVPKATPLTYEKFLGMVHPDDRQYVAARWEASLRGGPYDIEHRIVAGGQVKWVREKAYLEFDDAGNPLGGFGIAQDITERRRAEERIRQDNAVLKAINRILREALTGHTEEELGRRCLAEAEEVTRSEFGFLGEINVEGRLDTIAISDPGWEACRMKDPAGHKKLPADLKIHGLYGRAILDGKGFYTNDPAAHPGRVGTPQGHPPLSAFLGVPLKQNGKTMGLIAVANREGGYRPQDLEALEALAAAVVQVFLRKRAEQTVRAGEERLRKAQKMESIAVLAGGVAHDFNNLLVGVIGSASLATEMLPPASPAGSLLEQIMKSGERAADLTKQLLAYSGKGQFVIERINLSEVVRQVADLVRSTVPKKVAIQLDLDPGLPAIEADRTQIDQVLMNLVINAAEAIGDEVGLVLVQTGIQFVDERITRELESADIPPGRYLFLEVCDNGCGMDEATKAKIFDPFFTTKFQGRGLGLAAVAGIVRGHKGGIRIRTAPGRGTSIRVLFPASDSQPAPARRLAEVREEGAHIRGTVLVVDDEELVRNTAKLALETRGCDVLTASSGVDAISVVEQNAGRISVAILDFSMPGMSGQEVLTKLLAISPGLSVLISSGYAEADALRLFEGMPVTGFIQKPYTVRRLVERVATALREKRI